VAGSFDGRAARDVWLDVGQESGQQAETPAENAHTL
jgi:hypothetical protein